MDENRTYKGIKGIIEDDLTGKIAKIISNEINLKIYRGIVLDVLVARRLINNGELSAAIDVLDGLIRDIRNDLR